MPVETAYRKKRVKIIYGDEPDSTFESRVENGDIPPPDFYMGVTPFWFASTIERDQQAKVAARAKQREMRSRVASERYERSRPKRAATAAAKAAVAEEATR
jgi:hypothetical protein